ncbi:MAG: hypothetical protein NTV34_07625 [Proteobacteria bacterium]|nr:hypothetical protein [Pseudomonadota bacterium]
MRQTFRSKIFRGKVFRGQILREQNIHLTEGLRRKCLAALILLGAIPLNTCASPQKQTQMQTQGGQQGSNQSQNAQSNSNVNAASNHPNEFVAETNSEENVSNQRAATNQAGAAVNNFVEQSPVNTAEESLVAFPADLGITNVESVPVNQTPLPLTNNASSQMPAPSSGLGNVASSSNSTALQVPSASSGPGGSRVIDLGPPHGELRWVGYNFKKDERVLEVQVVTDGRPVYKIFQEVNRAKQAEIVIRFLNTNVRHKVRRDIDASEFRSPVAFIRMRSDKVFKHTDVILTMRDAVQPKFFAKGSSVMLTFPIPDRWYGPKESGQQPISKLEIQPDANVMPVADPASDVSPSSPTSIVAAYVDDPGKDTFGKQSQSQGIPLTKVEGSQELRPLAANSVSESPPLGGPVLVPAPTEPANNSLGLPGSDVPEVDSTPQDEIPVVDEKTEVRILEQGFWIAGVAQANANYLSTIPPPVVDASQGASGTGGQFDLGVTDSLEQPGNNPGMLNATASASSPEVVPVTTTDVIGVDQLTATQPAAVSSKKVMKFDFRNATIGSVLRAISSESGLNFIMPPEISNLKVTISLNNVGWDVALKAVLESNRLGMEEIGPKIIRIDALKTFSDDRDAQERAKQASEALVPTKVLIMKLSYTDAEEAAKMVLTMLPKPTDPSNVAQKRNYDRFKVQTDKRSNAVIVEATPGEIAKIKTLLERLDTRTPQVRIGSRIIEVIESAEKGLGISWGSPFNIDGGRGLGFGALPFPSSLSSTFAVDPGLKGEAVGAMSMRLGSINNMTALDLRLKMLESKSQAETLQNQDLLVEDNQEANIVAGQSDYFAISGGTTGGAELKEVAYNTSLKVKPHITSDGAVQMKLAITGDSPLQSASKNAEAGKTTRSLSTTLLKKSGDTAVIGGLYSTDKSKIVSGIPILSQIPILGALFRSTYNKDTRRDLLIMVTPTIQSGVSTSDGPGSTAGSSANAYGQALPTGSNFAASASGPPTNPEAAKNQQQVQQEQKGQQQSQIQQQQSNGQEEDDAGSKMEVSDDANLE